MDFIHDVSSIIDNNSERYGEISERIWAFAEIAYEEYKSAGLLSEILANEGFRVTQEAGGIPTAFIAEYGKGYPTIAIMGEYDALSGLSQLSGSLQQEKCAGELNGHGCGHNLLGTASLAAAIAVKSYLENNALAGTIRFYGCPAEEGGAGKAFMIREKLFDDVDAAICWHPFYANRVMHATMLANMSVDFKFTGISAHAGASPHLGRSALDAVELMNVGANYLREHMIDEARIHYAITNTGGHAANVVHAEAEVRYIIRAPQLAEVKELVERLESIAKGAALMTGTSVRWDHLGGVNGLLPNRTLEQVMQACMDQLELPVYTEEEVQLAASYMQTLNKGDRKDIAVQIGARQAKELAEQSLHKQVLPLAQEIKRMYGSSDIGDVSWNVPTVQCETATWALGTPYHTWQVVAQGKSSYAKKAMLLAAKTMAATAVNLLLQPQLVEEAKQELEDLKDGAAYDSPLPDTLPTPGSDHLKKV